MSCGAQTNKPPDSISCPLPKARGFSSFLSLRSTPPQSLAPAEFPPLLMQAARRRPGLAAGFPLLPCFAPNARRFGGPFDSLRSLCRKSLQSPLATQGPQPPSAAHEDSRGTTLQETTTERRLGHLHPSPGNTGPVREPRRLRSLSTRLMVLLRTAGSCEEFKLFSWAPGCRHCLGRLLSRPQTILSPILLHQSLDSPRVARRGKCLR